MKYDGLNGYSLLEDIEKANKKQDLKVLLGTILGGTTLLSLGHFLVLEQGASLEDIENKIEYIQNIVRNNLGISTAVTALIALRAKLISYNAKLRLEGVVDSLEDNEKIFVGVDSLQESKITPNDEMSVEGTKVIDILLEDRRGNEVKLREYTDDTILGEFSEVYLVDSKNRERKLVL